MSDTITNDSGPGANYQKMLAFGHDLIKKRCSAFNNNVEEVAGTVGCDTDVLNGFINCGDPMMAPLLEGNVWDKLIRYFGITYGEWVTGSKATMGSANPRLMAPSGNTPPTPDVDENIKLVLSVLSDFYREATEKYLSFHHAK